MADEEPKPLSDAEEVMGCFTILFNIFMTLLLACIIVVGVIWLFDTAVKNNKRLDVIEQAIGIVKAVP
jgi:anaerobic C4-dicarboxylate transporter